jgi:hypothetical protein
MIGGEGLQPAVLYSSNYGFFTHPTGPVPLLAVTNGPVAPGLFSNVALCAGRDAACWVTFTQRHIFCCQ